MKMYEKVNPSHPDKVADRISGAIVDLAYSKEESPKIAVEVLLGHGRCHVIIETSANINNKEVESIIHRIAGNVQPDVQIVSQDVHLATNQKDRIRCGDNGIFKGMPVTEEQRKLAKIAKDIYDKYKTDGKYILDGGKLIICQSNATEEDLRKDYPDAIINPLGYWTGGTDVDSGCTNRKLGSDMADSVTGGGLCLSADTEYLGDDLKWHRMDSYKGGKVAQWNNGMLEFITPNKYVHNEIDDFIKIWNDTKLSMELTPYHNMLIETSKGNLIKKPAYLIAQKLDEKRGNSGKIIHNFTYKNKSNTTAYPTESDYRLQVAFCADGSILHDQNKWSGRIRVKKQRKKDRLRKLLKNHEYMETIDGEYSIFWFNPIKVSKSLYDCFYKEDFNILYDEIYHWDGSINTKVFYTTNKVDADFIQFIIGTMGKVATITIDDRVGQQHCRGYDYKSICYAVHELKSTKTNLRVSKGVPIKVEYKKEKQPSYCFEVPSHNLIVRHNNKIFITGNCGKDCSKADVSVNIYAWLKAQQTGHPVEISCAIGDEIVDGKPYDEIVTIAKDYIDSIGGFEKFSEWGLVR